MEVTIKYFRSIGIALLWPILCSLISQGCGKDENPENPAIDMTLVGIWETAADQLTMTLTGPDGEPGTLVYEYIIDGILLSLKWMLPNETKFYAGFSRQE